MRHSLRAYVLMAFAAIALAGCDVSDVGTYEISLAVTPPDTVRAVGDQSVVFNCYVSARGYGLSRQPIAVKAPGESNFASRIETDSSGHALYRTSRLPDADTVPNYAFVVSDANGYNRSIVLTRTVIVRKVEPFSVSITARGVAEDALVPEPYLPTVHTLVRRAIEILPRIFFENNSAGVPERYRPLGDAPSFSLNTSEDEVNHRVLDIVGKRLADNPEATIVVTGANQNSKEEKDNVALSRARSLRVADYLRTVWDIDSARLLLDARNLPAKPTNPVVLEGMEENRRVDLSSSNTAILAPVVVDSTWDSIGTSRIAFIIQRDRSVAIRSWRITASLEGRDVIAPIVATDPTSDTISTDLQIGPADLNSPIHYMIEATDTLGRTAVADGYTRVVSRSVSFVKPVGDYSVWFDYDDPTLNTGALRMLQATIDILSNGSVASVEMEGHTSPPETDAHLADLRAQNLSTELRKAVGNLVSISLKASTSTGPRFPLALPEGRQLARRVAMHFVP